MTTPRPDLRRTIPVLCIPLMLLFLGCSRESRPPRVKLERIAVVKKTRLSEASALLPSRLHPGVFWTLNDSGNGPQLFAIDREGRLLGEFQVRGALNVDWEALASDDGGHLYIGDVGNNGGILGARWVYQVKEPATLPEQPGKLPLPELTIEKTFSFSFPDKPFDCEAMVYAQASLYLISKLKERPALYRLPLDRPGESVKLSFVCNLPEDLTLVTDAALSTDGKRLAVISYGYAARIELQPGQPLAKLEGTVPTIQRYKTLLVEGCGWDGEELLLITEPGELHRLRF